MAKVLADKEWLTRKEAAEHLRSLGYQISHMTLSNMSRVKKRRGYRGPPFRAFLGRNVTYERVALEAWARANTRLVG